MFSLESNESILLRFFVVEAMLNLRFANVPGNIGIDDESQLVPGIPQCS